MPDSVVAVLIMIVLCIVVRLSDRKEDKDADQYAKQQMKIRNTTVVNSWDHGRLNDELAKMNRKWENTNNGKHVELQRHEILVNGSPSDLNRASLDTRASVDFINQRGGDRFAIGFTKPEREDDPYQQVSWLPHDKSCADGQQRMRGARNGANYIKPKSNPFSGGRR